MNQPPVVAKPVQSAQPIMAQVVPPVVARPVRLDPSKPVGTPVRSRHEPLRDMASIAKDKDTGLVAKVLTLVILGALFAAAVYSKFAIFH